MKERQRFISLLLVLSMMFSTIPFAQASTQLSDSTSDLAENPGSVVNETIERGTLTSDMPPHILDYYDHVNLYLSELDTLNLYKDIYDITPEQEETARLFISYGTSALSALFTSFAIDYFSLDATTVLDATLLKKSNEAEPDEITDDLSKFAILTNLPDSICVSIAVQGSVQQLSANFRTYCLELLQDEYRPGDTAAGLNQSALAATRSSTGEYSPERILEAPLSYHKNGNIEVNVNNGLFKYSETDLSLPGKNGLDFNLTRFYNYSDAMQYIPYGSNFGSSDYYAVIVGYDLFELNESNPTSSNKVTSKNISIYGEYEINQLIKGIKFKYDSDEWIDAPNGKYYPNTIFGAMLLYNDLMERNLDDDEESILAERYDGPGYNMFYIVHPRITPFNTSYLYNGTLPNDYDIRQFGLGQGWRFSLPTVESYLTNEIYEDGISYIVEEYRLVTRDGRRLNANDNGAFDHYELEDMLLNRTSGGYPGAYWTLEYRDGTFDYFNRNGDIIATVDRFGNKITYEHIYSNNALSQLVITDTMGRRIVYKNEQVNKNNPPAVQAHGSNLMYNVKHTLTVDGTLIKTYYSYDFENSGSVIRPRSLHAVSDENADFTMYTADLNYVNFNIYMPQRDSSDGRMIWPVLNKVAYSDGSVLKIVTDKNAILNEQLGIAGYISRQPVTRVQYDYKYEGVEYQLFTDYDYSDPYQSSIRFVEGGRKYAYHSVVTKGMRLFNFSGGYVDVPTTRTEMYFGTDHTREYEKTYERKTFQEETINNTADLNAVIAQNTLKLSSESWYSYDRYHLPIWIRYKQYNNPHQNISGSTEAVYSYTNNHFGEHTKEVQPNGQIIETSYHNYGLLRQQTYKQDAVTTIQNDYQLTPDKKNIQTATVTVNGITKARTDYTYSSVGSLESVKKYDSENSYHETFYEYENFAQPALIRTVNVKDSAGNLVAGSPGFPTGTLASRQSYDDRGRVSSITNQLGGTSFYTYDKRGKITSITNPDGSSSSFAYTYDYSQNPNYVVHTDTVGTKTEQVYDTYGNLREINDLTNGDLLQKNEYDHLNRLMRKTIYSDEANAVTYYYHYDWNNRLTETGIRHSATSRTPLEAYEYFDGQRQVVHTRMGEAGAPEVVTKSWQDEMGNTVKTAVLTATNALGDISSYAYDWLGRISSATDFKGSTSNYSYDNANRLLREQHPFEQSGSVIRCTESLYDYDPAGNVISQRQSNNLPGAIASYARVDYAYDNMNRVNLISQYDRGTAKGFVQYTYDPLGNVTGQYTGQSAPLNLPSSTPAGDYGLVSYEYDTQGRVTALVDPLGQREEYTYDLQGRITSKIDRNGATTAYTYNPLGNLLSSVVTDSEGKETGRITNTYYANGLLKLESSNGLTTTYTYNDQGLIHQEKDNTGAYLRPCRQPGDLPSPAGRRCPHRGSVWV